MIPSTRIPGNYLDLMDDTAARLPDKAAFISESNTITFSQLRMKSMNVGSFLLNVIKPRQPVAVLMARDVWAVTAIIGVVQAGGISAPLDPAMPAERLMKVFETLNPACLVVDNSAKKAVEGLKGKIDYPIYYYDDIANTEIDEERIYAIRETIGLTDPIVIYYTSGSTGMPKGVVHTHWSIISYTERVMTFTNVQNEDTICGNQAPFFYVNAIHDLWLPINCGNTVVIIPNEIFLFPEAFLNYMNEKKITVILMTPLNYIYIADAGVLSPGCLPYLEGVYLIGEVVPADKMKVWVEACSNARCWNFYGSTEAPYISLYEFGVPGKDDFGAGKIVPSGVPLRTVRILLIDENGNEAAPGETGDIYVTAPWISSGYYNNIELTREKFIRDPLEEGWTSIYFKSGDWGYFNQDGDLIVIGRRDTQIKHRGFRMDVGEVNTALLGVDGWQNGCVLFSEAEDLLYCFWVGPLTEKELKLALSKKIERYMMPNIYVHLDELPRTSSGKLDRMFLKEKYFGMGTK